MTSSSYSSSLSRALWSYPALLAILSATIGLRQPTEVRDRRHWRDAVQKALKLVSTTHAIVTSTLAARDVFADKWTKLNLITTRSSDANTVVALETGYLVQDTLVCALLDSKWSPVNTLIKGTDVQKIRFDPLILTHHVSLGSLLLLFLEFARRGKEKGIFFVEMFLVMNASTPLLNLRWWLAKKAKASSSSSSVGKMQSISMVNDAALVMTFFVCRIGLIFYMLWLYGLRTGRSIWQSYLSIPLQCKTGTASLLILNSVWWLGLLRKTLSKMKQRRI